MLYENFYIRCIALIMVSFFFSACFGFYSGLYMVVVTCGVEAGYPDLVYVAQYLPSITAVRVI